MPIIGSHNSMTYLKSRNLFFNIFSFCWRCQKNNYETQFLNGARCFDMRIVYKNDKWQFVHGKAILQCDNVDEVFSTLNRLAVVYTSKLHIRLLLETSSANEEMENKFIEYAKQLHNKFTPSLIVFECRRKFDWKELISFDVYPKVEQYVGSMQKWYGKIWPWLYWKLNNKKNLEKSETLGDTDIALFDFV